LRTTVVASVNPEYDWAAYIGATPEHGISNDEAETFIAKNGDKISEEVARAFFPTITERYRP
jgi:ribonucleotide reductase beta subunit family protein with ferritin-like domain